MEYYNEITLVGTVKEILDYYEYYGEWFYQITLSVKRFSGVVDELIVVIPSCHMKVEDYVGKKVEVYGTIRRKRKTYIFAEWAYATDSEDVNRIYLVGNVFKPITHRVTPLGRKISEIALYTEYRAEKRSIIQCVAWGNKATWSKAHLKIDDVIEVYGRLQSRDYEKVLDDGKVEKRRTYEVSVNKITLI